MTTIRREKGIESMIKMPEMKVGSLTNKFSNLEKERFGIVPVALIWTVCWGSVAVGLGAMQSPILLAFLVFPTMTLLSFCLAVQPVRTIIWIGIGATLIDWLVIGYLFLV